MQEANFSQGSYAPRHERGATLILVLLILLCLTLIGAYSVRQSSTDMSLTTSSQINELTFQTSEMALAKIEADARATSNSLEITNFRGYVLQQDKTNNPVTFCLRPKSNRLFSYQKVTENLLGDPTSYVSGKSAGYCNPNDTADFISSRDANITQVTAINTIPDKCAIFGCELDGTSSNDLNLGASGDNTLSTKFIEVYSVSVLPAFAADLGAATATGTNSLSGCLRNTSLVTADTDGKPKYDPDGMSDCLRAINVPFDVHNQTYESYVIGFDTL